ncbi:glycosyltransferase, partial [Patescibacteria group bacterium]|nr:glycosyltransferase [Patescibacteria group bacterium]
MRLSIIIVNWNTAKLLRQCLDSLVSSINPPAGGQVLSIEIIVVDNGSTDNSVEEVKKFIVHSSLFNIQLIENQANLGFAKAVNQALRQVYTERNRSAQGEAFFLLNSD